MQAISDWIGRSETAEDLIHPYPAAALAAALDLPPRRWAEAEALPPLWHWLYTLSAHRAGDLGPDGHARLGGFLPPMPALPDAGAPPRRMWAGGRLAFRAPLRMGQRVQRRSVVEQVQAKQGRSGPLLFVTVRHALHVQGEAEAALVEHHDIVYRSQTLPAPGGRAEPGPPPAAVWERSLVPDPVLLFRYSALTFNGHRIHYDRRWATDAEGYPGLVVHGPLIATLLLDLLHRHAPGAVLRGFEFRALAPAFDGASLQLCGQPLAGGEAADLWAQGPAGELLMRARATFG